MSAAPYLWVFTYHYHNRDNGPLALVFDHVPTQVDIITKMADMPQYNTREVADIVRGELQGMPPAEELIAIFDAAEARCAATCVKSPSYDGGAVLAIQRVRAP